METGGPAFPNVPDGAGDKWADWDMGMTMRDYFAAKAMQSLILTRERVSFSLCEIAYEVADTMLKARSAHN
ncbi:hypothetical protein [Cedecea neteri]|uniref:hypothetical protein n=1 Tax=Cedecea neteri TaxID=158822 RepID=UPI0028A2D38E|nr:hypothetical protein [Cedecea neteri]